MNGYKISFYWDFWRNQLIWICPVCHYVPHHRGGGHTVFSADIVGVGVSVASCVHSISLMNGWIMAKLTKIYHWVGKNADKILTLTPFSRSHEDLDCWKKLENCLCAPYLMTEKNWLDFGVHDPIFKVRGSLRLLENGLSAPFLMKEWIDLTKLAQLYCCDMKKNWLDFRNLDPIFKVREGLRLLENALSAFYLQNEWMDLDQTCTAILLRQGQKMIRFWLPWPHFQGHTRA